MSANQVLHNFLSAENFHEWKWAFRVSLTRLSGNTPNPGSCSELDIPRPNSVYVIRLLHVFLCIWPFRLNLVWICPKLFCQHLSLNRDHFLINYQIFIIMLISFPSKSDNVSTVCTLTLQAAISFFQAFCIELNRPRNICPSLKGKFFSLTDRYVQWNF